MNPTLRLAALTTALTLPLLAVDHHVTTAQEFQNALTIAAANGTDDTIFLAAGLYQGNFNFVSAEAFSLTIQAEAGIAADQIVLDGAGVGGTLNLNCADLANLWLSGITIKRNTGNANLYALSAATVGNVNIEHCVSLALPTNWVEASQSPKPRTSPSAARRLPVWELGSNADAASCSPASPARC